jgi:hypothetical protein
MKKIIAIKERSAGNETVGDMWLETASFDITTPIGDILKWSNETTNSKLIITVDQSTIEKPDF